MSFIQIDTDRGILYGPTFDDTLTYFFGQSQPVAWDCHQLTAGYVNGAEARTTPIQVQHHGSWITAARTFGTHTLDRIPDEATQTGVDYAFSGSDMPRLPRWVYDWTETMLR